MVLVRVLKRRDASSVVVAVVVAMILYQLVQVIPAKWASWISGLSSTGFYGSSPPGNNWKSQYLYPVVLTILELIVLEVLGWIYIWATGSMKRK